MEIANFSRDRPEFRVNFTHRRVIFTPLDGGAGIGFWKGNLALGCFFTCSGAGKWADMIG